MNHSCPESPRISRMVAIMHGTAMLRTFFHFTLAKYLYSGSRSPRSRRLASMRSSKLLKSAVIVAVALLDFNSIIWSFCNRSSPPFMTWRRIFWSSVRFFTSSSLTAHFSLLNNFFLPSSCLIISIFFWIAIWSTVATLGFWAGLM